MNNSVYDLKYLVEFCKTLYRFELVGEEFLGKAWDIYYNYTRASFGLMHDVELLEKNLQSWNNPQ